MITNGDDCAFSKTANRDFCDTPEYGLTKREYFAAMAMQGLLAGHYEYFKGNDDVSVSSMIAEYAVSNAEALIEALNKNKSNPI